MAENTQGKQGSDNENLNTGQGNPAKKSTSNRGFASMSPEQQREIASKGGQAAHEQGVAHKWTSEEAREAGRKGGQASHGGGRSSTSEEPRENTDTQGTDMDQDMDNGSNR